MGSQSYQHGSPMTDEENARLNDIRLGVLWIVALSLISVILLAVLVWRHW